MQRGGCVARADVPRQPVRLVQNWVDGGFTVAAGEVVLLENCRCNKGEKKNSEELAQKMAKLCDIYMKMYEDFFNNCNDPEWIIVPADQNWYQEWVVANAIYEKLVSLDMKYPGLKK